MSSETTQTVTYPLRKENGEKKWTPQFRQQWNKEYRDKIKSGELVPHVRESTKQSKWNDPNFRKAYDRARLDALKEKSFQERTSFDQNEPFKHYSKEQKMAILNKMVELIKDGKDHSHPHFDLNITLKDQFKSKRQKRSIQVETK